MTFITSQVIVALTCFAFLCVGVTQGFYQTYGPCIGVGEYPSGGNFDSDVKIEIDGGFTSYNGDKMYQATLTTQQAFNYVMVTSQLPGETSVNRGDTHLLESSADVPKCSLVYTYMSPMSTDSLSFFFMAPSSGSGCVVF